MYWALLETLVIKRGTRQRPLISGIHMLLMTKKSVFRTNTATQFDDSNNELECPEYLPGAVCTLTAFNPPIDSRKWGFL